MTPQQNPNSSEYSPDQRQVNNELSPEAIQAQGELHQAWDETLYGDLEGQKQDGEIAVEGLGNRVDERDVRAAMDVDKQPDTVSQIDDMTVSENAATRNAREATQMTGEVLARFGATEEIAGRDMMNRIVGEQLSDGTTEFGDLSQENKRDVAEAMVAQQFAAELDSGNTGMVDSLPPSTAIKVMTQLWQLRMKYGEVRRIPNDELAPLGEMIMAAEKHAPREESEAQPDTEEDDIPQSQEADIAEARRLVEQAQGQLAA